MKARGLSILAGILMVCAITSLAVAGLAAYVRLDYGGNRLRMTEGKPDPG
jgi:hypothetical protein